MCSILLAVLFSRRWLQTHGETFLAFGHAVCRDTDVALLTHHGLAHFKGVTYELTGHDEEALRIRLFIGLQMTHGVLKRSIYK